MATFVNSKVVHPAATLESEHDFILNRTFWRAVDVYVVKDLTTGSESDNQTALQRALSASGVPKIGSSYGGQPGKEGCVCSGHTVEPIPASDDAVYLLVHYQTPAPFTGPLQNVRVVNIEKDTITRTISVVLHPKDLSQMVVDAPNLPQAPGSIFAPTPSAPPVPAYVPFDQPLTRMTITAVIPTFRKDLEAVENLVGCVNGRPWFGFDRGYWKFDAFKESTSNATTTSSNYVTIACEFLTQRLLPWFHYEIRHSEQLGVPLAVDDKTLKQVFGLGYFYGWKRFPGVTVAGMSPLADFQQAFGIGSRQQWLGRQGPET